MTNWTPQQQEIINFVRDEKDSLVIQASAGSGKTTTLVGAANVARGTKAAIAFNRRIADTLQQRMDNTICRTMNSFGHRAWQRHIGRRVKLETSKLFNISSDDKYKPYDFRLRVVARQLASLAKHHGILPEGAVGSGKGIFPDDEATWSNLIAMHDIEVNGDEARAIELARLFLLDDIRQGWDGLIDFDDQIYLPACFRSPLDKFDTVFVDEAQDISNIQRTLIERMTKGRIIAVGDRAQAIYFWRGASATSLDEFLERFQAQELPLSVSFRCPKSVVREAREIYQHIEAWDQSPEGIVNRKDDWSLDNLEPGSTIICRNNAPIITLAFRMLKQGIGCKVVGRDIGAGMKSTLKKLGAPDQITRSAEMLRLLDQEMKQRVENAVARRRPVENIYDKYQSIIAVVEQCATTRQALNAIEQMFEEGRGQFDLSTIHRFKGLENKRIYFLNRFLIPSKWAKTDEALVQEDNLAYVGVTRAMRQLTYINLKRD